MIFTNEDKTQVKGLRQNKVIVLKIELIFWQAVVAFITGTTAAEDNNKPSGFHRQEVRQRQKMHGLHDR